MQHNFLTRLVLTLTLLVGFSPLAWADEHNEAARYAGFEALPAAQDGDVVFIGNSITHMMNWWEAYGNKHNIHGRGNSGAKTYQALANLESMIAGQPSKAFVMLGTNDFGNMDNPPHVAHLVKTLCKRILLESPRTTVYLQSILPSNNGDGRNQANMTAANSLLKQWVDAEHNERLVYVDLYALLDNGSGSIRNSSNNRTTSWSYDDLHLTPRAYRVWMNEIEQYLDGAECVIPDNDNLQNLHADQQTSWGARIATFGTMPVAASDILMFGDDFIHYGEWHEMISSSTAGESSTDFKDRGTGWQFFSSNISRVQAALEPALSKTQYNVQNCGVQRVTPRAICISAGGRNIMDGNDDSAIQQAYLGLVNAARAQVDASTPIFLMSIMPLDDAAKNAKVKTLNAYMQTLASTMANVHYVDLYGAMTTGDAQTAKYFHANRNWALNGGVTIHPYPTPLGYVKAANVLCAKLNSVLSTHYTALSETEAQHNIDRFNNRSIVGNAVTDVYNKLYNVGDAPGQYSASNVEEAETLIAEACKVLWNTDVTTAQANTAIAPLQAMTFTVNLPKTSDATHQYYYTISDKRGTKYITANSTNNTLAANATASSAADQQWRLTQNADGSFNIQNVLTGGYLNMTTSTITTSADVPSKGWTLTSVGDGYFTIVSGTDQLNNANNTGTTVHNWGSGTSGPNGNDTGCYYRFVLAEEIVPPVVPAGPALDYPAGSGLNNLMPRPQQVKLGSGTYSGTIDDAKVEKISASALAALGVEDYEVAGFDNEGYQLIITTSGITIKAATDLGVIRAKQTLAQMEQGGTFECCEIVDWPAFKVRGYMHDVGRSFISYDEIKKEIDLLARFKVNMFHWHLTDYHAFRFESKLHPDVNKKAFERFVGQYYSQEECKALDAYAHERGVVIIPEIDMPGHSRQFKNATGYDMNSTDGQRILKDILGEVAECFPNAPYIHVGADETSVTQQYVKEMTDYIHTKGKKTICWQTYGGGTVNPTNMGVDMLTNWATSGRLVNGVPNIDMRYFYVNHFDVFADLEGAYRSLIFDAEKGNPNIGGISIGIWNDRYLSDEKQIIAQNNLYAAALAITERAWCGGTYKDNHHQYIEKGRAYLPNEGWEYEEFADWERRFLHYKNTWLSEVAENIPYVKQTNIRWNITKGYDNGGDKTQSFDPETAVELTVEPGSTFATGAGVWLNHIWAGTVNGVFPSSQSYNQTRYAWTYVYSPTAQTVGAQIEFRNYSRSDAGLVPRNGEWDIMGSRVWVNGKEYNPTWEWSNAGVNPGAESDLGNLNFPGRKPIKVQLQQGWNKVLLKLPYINIGNGGGNRPNKWQYTFVFTDTEGRNAVDGLVYSPTKSTDGTENFTVPSAPRIAPTASTSAETHWYTIKSKRENRLVTNSENMVSATAAASNTYWKFVDRGDHTYDIISYTDGRYISPVASNNARLSCTTERPSAGWSLGEGQTDGYFLIYSGSTQFNQTGSAHSYELYNWGYGSQTAGQYRADDDGCQFIFTEIKGLTAPDAPAAQRYTIRLVDTDFYFTTNEVSDNSNKTYSISTEPEVFVVNKVDGGYTIVSENGKQVGVNSNGWDFANSAYTWNIENIEEPTRILMNGQQKGIGVDSKTNNAPAFTDKHSGNANNDATRYTWVFEAVDAPDAGNVYYTITNHQKKDSKSYAFYVEGSQLKVGDVNVPASEYGDKALFVKEAKGDKWAFRNKDSGEYLVFRGKGYGTNSDKGVVSAYDTNYCDFSLISNNSVTNGVIISGKRSNGNVGTFVLSNAGAFDAWGDTNACWNDTYSNIFTLEEVRIAAATVDYIIDKDHGNLYKTDGSVNSGWNATWKSTQQPELQFVAYDRNMAEANNMTWSGTTVQLETGQLAPCTYTISAPEGYVIDSFSFDYTAKTATTVTLTYNGTPHTTSATAQTISATAVNAQTASFTLSGTNGAGTLLTNFVVRLRPIGSEPEPEPDVLFTTEADATAGQYRWVRITNVRNAYSIYASSDAALHSHTTDFTAEGELFALVGTEENFKLYSRTAQAYFGYSASTQDSPVTKGAATQTFKLVSNTSNAQPGINIVPTANAGQSFNMHGGAGQDIKFYSSGDAGSTWKITLVDTEIEGSIRLVGTPNSELNRLIGKVRTTVGGTTGETLVTLENIEALSQLTYYINESERSNISVAEGYTFRGYSASIDGMSVTYTADTDNRAQYLFYSTGAEHPYRIPSISRTRSGRLIAFSDYRFGGGDIGNGRVDIVARTSDDNGRTWSPERTILQGDGNGSSRTCGFGDAASVADCETDDVMLMCCSAPNGGTCWTAAQRGVVCISHDGGQTWGDPVDIKDQICNASGSLLDGTNIVNYFVGSGKLHQSRYIKVGTHYRVYAPLFTTPGSGYNNYVVYTDDFGQTWHLLGSATTPCVAGGNEPKCEELPDGSVIISSRKGSGRYYNVFTYAKTDNADFSKGSWGSSVTGCNSGDSGTDGEILLLKAERKSDGKLVTIALQSMPNSGRNNVSIWYKELSNDPAHQFASSDFSGAWTLGKQVSNTSSAYTTMCMQADGRIAFFFEEGPAGYEMVYLPLSISEATGGAYGPDDWTIGHVAKAVEKADEGTCTLREILDIERYLLHPAK